jgi:hypothetical protein
MSPNIICLGELLVEIMRTEVDTPHGIIGASYKGPFPIKYGLIIQELLE